MASKWYFDENDNLVYNARGVTLNNMQLLNIWKDMGSDKSNNEICRTHGISKSVYADIVRKFRKLQKE